KWSLRATRRRRSIGCTGSSPRGSSPRARSRSWPGRRISSILVPTAERRSLMHAVLVRVTIDDPEQATKALRERVVPQVRQAPGLVAGYWVRLDGNQGRSIVVFDSEEAARAVADQVRAMPTEFVTIDSVDVHEVVAHT